ncbi:hypothetical protein D1AOALGA4SA_6758 [Olavius algarvensis Delta 1 endosymbiont]|nr:hypothetical protein D1AOALGA4SA_6758 [Olavius algarvensis Delta 1 endosymbiont]
MLYQIPNTKYQTPNTKHQTHDEFDFLGIHQSSIFSDLPQ